jgi:hypothetical protein
LKAERGQQDAFTKPDTGSRKVAKALNWPHPFWLQILYRHQRLQATGNL